MGITFMASYLWWRLLGISLCAVMLPAYLIYFRKIDASNKVAITIFGTTVVLAQAFIWYNFGFMAFIVGLILWTVLAFLIKRLFIWVSAGQEY